MTHAHPMRSYISPFNLHDLTNWFLVRLLFAAAVRAGLALHLIHVGSRSETEKTAIAAAAALTIADADADEDHMLMGRTFKLILGT